MLKKPFLLYKIHENEDCNTLQQIVRFLYVHGIDFRPLAIIERDFPSSITEYPTLIDYENVIFKGLDEIVTYIERKTNSKNIVEKAISFHKKNPEYRIAVHNRWINKLVITSL